MCIRSILHLNRWYLQVSLRPKHYPRESVLSTRLGFIPLCPQIVQGRNKQAILPTGNCQTRGSGSASLRSNLEPGEEMGETSIKSNAALMRPRSGNASQTSRSFIPSFQRKTSITDLISHLPADHCWLAYAGFGEFV